MKTELRARPHNVTPGAFVFEVWHNGQFIAEVTGADGAGVRVISKHPMAPKPLPLNSSAPHVIEVAIHVEAMTADRILAALAPFDGKPLSNRVLDALPGGRVAWKFRRDLGWIELVHTRSDFTLLLARAHAPLSVAWVAHTHRSGRP